MLFYTAERRLWALVWLGVLNAPGKGVTNCPKATSRAKGSTSSSVQVSFDSTGSPTGRSSSLWRQVLYVLQFQRQTVSRLSTASCFPCSRTHTRTPRGGLNISARRELAMDFTSGLWKLQMYMWGSPLTPGGMPGVPSPEPCLWLLHADLRLIGW